MYLFYRRFIFLFEFRTSNVAFCVFSAAEWEGKGNRRHAVSYIQMKAVDEIGQSKVGKGVRYQ